MLPTNQRQESLSRAYVRAVAARAGVICTTPEQDFGLDLFLRGVEHREQAYLDVGPQIDIQLKSSTQAEIRQTDIAYDLEVRAYNLLRDPVFGPRILVLLVLPVDEAFWMNQSEDGLLLRRCAYWLSLQGAASTNNQSTIRVVIPRTNVFSPEAIQNMMAQVRQGLPL